MKNFGFKRVELLVYNELIVDIIGFCEFYMYNKEI